MITKAWVELQNIRLHIPFHFHKRAMVLCTKHCNTCLKKGIELSYNRIVEQKILNNHLKFLDNATDSAGFAR